MRYWKRIDSNNNTTTVESYSHNLDVEGAVEIDKAEFDGFIDSLPPPPPPIDWKAEWQLADTAIKKLTVLARRLGLE